MKVQLHVIGHDPWSTRKRWEPAVEQCTEEVDADVDGPFDDGPSSRRLKTVDSDPRSTVPVSLYESGDQQFARYIWSAKDTVYDPGFLRTNAFGLVLKTLQLYEEPEALGRPIRWAFPSEQLKLRVRGAEGKDARYSRDEESLSFGSFNSPIDGNRVYAALSRDIICHEAGHAILDGIAPDLFTCWTPECLAIHEAVADLTAIWMALEYGVFRFVMADKEGMLLRRPSELNAIGDEFARQPNSVGVPAIRSLLDMVHRRRDALKFSASGGHYQLSLVLSGAIYRLMVRSFDELIRDTDDPPALCLQYASDFWRRVVIRGLDLLPPGEVALSDLARAMLVANSTYGQASEREHGWFDSEMVECGVVSRAEMLLRPEELREQPVDRNLAEAVGDLRATQRLVEACRQQLELASGVSVASSRRITAGGRQFAVLKLTWSVREPSPPGTQLVRRGMTLLCDLERNSIVARILPFAEQDAEERDILRSQRIHMQRWLAEQGSEIVSVDGALRPRSTNSLLVNPRSAWLG